MLGPLKIVKIDESKEQFEVELDVPGAFFKPHEIDVSAKMDSKTVLF